MTTYQIKLPLFEGPFDLLLFFIERDEIDIYDIPIAIITNDFLDYLKKLEQMNMEVASEFILVAATLMKIKAKMLLPRPQLDEEGNEIDPREDLVRHLLEYKQYKSVVSLLAKMEESRLLMKKRGNLKQELNQLSRSTNVEAELQDVDLYKLLKVFQRALDKYAREKNKPMHTVIPFPFTIDEKKESIMSHLGNGKPISFLNLVQQDLRKIAVIFNFLAILELLQSGQIAIQLGEGANNFWLSLPSPKERRVA